MSDFETLFSGWYVIRTKVREELRAAENLENQGFETYCPQFLEKKREEILFPGYLFLRLGEEDVQRYHKIRSTRGVLSIVTFNKTQHKITQAGRGNYSCNQELQSLLPRPIPGGDKIIEQIEEIIWILNGGKKEQKPTSMTYKEGDLAIHSNPLYAHLQFTFKRGMKADRGVFLVQYIQTQRLEEGVKEQVVSEQEMKVAYKELKKA